MRDAAHRSAAAARVATSGVTYRVHHFKQPRQGPSALRRGALPPICEETMSLIQYQQATYAIQLREQLERAGCDARVAALMSRAVGELIDHVSQAESELKRDIKEKVFHASMRMSDVSAFKRDLFDRFVGVTLFVLAVAIVVGVLIALFR
jgi:hypothetical protein